MISEKLDRIVKEFPDFPKQGVNFKDITPILQDADISTAVVDAFIDRLLDVKLDAIVGIESRGFLFGFLLANKMGIPFVPIRKAGKLPGETLKHKYALEYGFAEIEIHKSDVKKDWNVLIHDDLLATGGTACGAALLLQKLDVNVAGFAFVISLEFLKGRQKLVEYSNNIITLKEY